MTTLRAVWPFGEKWKPLSVVVLQINKSNILSSLCRLGGVSLIEPRGDFETGIRVNDPDRDLFVSLNPNTVHLM